MEEGADRNVSASRSADREKMRSLLMRGAALDEKLKAWGGPGAARLRKLVRAELSFLNRVASAPLPPASAASGLLRSSNFDHLEDVFGALQHPLVSGVSAVMQNIAASRPRPSASGRKGGAVSNETAHVDVSCTLGGKPVWLIISSGNPRYVRWAGAGKKGRPLRARLLCVLRAAMADEVKRPESILLCFAGQVPADVDRGLANEFSAIRTPSMQTPRRSGATQDSEERLRCPDPEDRDLLPCKFTEIEGGEWLDVDVKNDSPWDESWKTYEVCVASFEGRSRTEGNAGQLEGVVSTFSQSIEGESERDERNGMEVCCSSPIAGAASDQQIGLVRSIYTGQHAAEADGQKLVSLDTTALVALTSEVSNGGAAYLLALPEGALEKRFPSMSTFIYQQALSEVEKPLVNEMEETTAGCQWIISRYVCNEFSSIVSQVGGSKEKETAAKLLERIRVVPDVPSARVMALPLSGRIKQRHKIVFGTGDFWNAPTFTANMAFVRAARDRGLSMSILEHRPRAFLGD